MKVINGFIRNRNCLFDDNAIIVNEITEKEFKINWMTLIDGLQKTMKDEKLKQKR